MFYVNNMEKDDLNGSIELRNSREVVIPIHFEQEALILVHLGS